MMSISTDDSHRQESSRIVLFGGSSLATTYVPEEMKHRTLLEQRLREEYPEQEIEVLNCADNGEFFARYLLNGVYEQHRSQLQGVDVAIFRFGANDEKRMEHGEYARHMRIFVDLLRQDFPGVHIVLQTLIYLDYPTHYLYDRNQELEPFSEVSRKLAKESGFTLSDFYEAGKRETDKGNWDFRVRQGLVLDNSKDSGKENEVVWFSDIHPNPKGIRIAVEEDIRVLRERFPESLPAGQVAVPRTPYTTEEYERILDFPKTRLTLLRKPNPEQQLQQASQYRAP